MVSLGTHTHHRRPLPASGASPRRSPHPAGLHTPLPTPPLPCPSITSAVAPSLHLASPSEDCEGRLGRTFGRPGSSGAGSAWGGGTGLETSCLLTGYLPIEAGESDGEGLNSTHGVAVVQCEDIVGNATKLHHDVVH